MIDLAKIIVHGIAYTPKPKSADCLTAKETLDAMFIVKDMKKDLLNRPFDIFAQPANSAISIGSIASALLLQGKVEPFCLQSLDYINSDIMYECLKEADQLMAAKTKGSGNDLCLIVGDNYFFDIFTNAPRKSWDTIFELGTINYLPE